MKIEAFDPKNFVDTQWETAEDKSKFLNNLVDFIKGGFKRTKFTKALYKRLSLTFGHVAHYNINGFYSEWFSDEDKQNEWLRHMLYYKPVGDPTYTYSDAEKAFVNWLWTSRTFTVN